DGFFFQAEDGIRDFHVTGVQTCALPISAAVAKALVGADLDLAADVCGDLAAQVTLHLVVAFDVIAQGDELVVGEVLDADRLVDRSEERRVGRECSARWWRDGHRTSTKLL